MLMPHNKKHDVSDYWLVDDIISTPMWGRYMPRDRFLQILGYLHFSDNANPVEDDPLWKIRDFINMIK